MNSFPLLRLSQSVQQKVIQNMDSIDQLSLSVCSKLAKIAVKNSRLNLQELHLRFENRLTLHLVFGDRPKLKIVLIDAQNNGARQLDLAQTVHFFAWRGLNLGFGSWIRHLLSVYFGTKLVICVFNWDNDYYDVGSIKRCLNGVNIRSIYYFTKLSERNLQLLLTSEISSDCVTIYNVRHQDALGLRTLLAQNLSFFEYAGRFLTDFSSLSNFLSINSRTVNIDGANLSDKDLNRFLKLWKTGAAPRLQYMSLSLNPDREIDKDIVFKGVDHVVTEPGYIRHVEIENMTGRRVIDVQGGCDVTRADGVKATIKIYRLYFYFYLLK